MSPLPPHNPSNFYSHEKSSSHRSLLNSLTVPIACFDKNLKISFANNQALKFWGYEDSSEILDKSLNGLLSQEEKFKAIFDQLISKNNWSGKFTGVKKNNSSIDVEASFNPIEFNAGEVEWIVTFKKAKPDYQNKKLYKKYKRRFLDFFRSAPDAIFIVSGNGIIEMANPKSEKLFGYRKEEMIGKTVEALIPRDLRQQHIKKRNAFKKCPSQRSMGSDLELYGLRKDGDKIPLDIMLGPFEEEGEKKVLVIARDITRLKNSSEKIKSSLIEKETLLKEVHHRVKNNLAVVSSLLRLQAEQTLSKQVLAALQKAINRIQSIAAVHEQIYQEELFSSIELKIYIDKLCTILNQHYNDGDRKVEISIECDDIKPSMEKAVPIALILNEIITNSFKYATATGKCQVWITVKKVNDSILLKIKDNGPGLPNHYLNQKQKKNLGLGLTLINVLSRQLGADLKIENTPGATYTLEFSL